MENIQNFEYGIEPIPDNGVAKKAVQMAGDVKDKLNEKITRVGDRVNASADAAMTAVGTKMDSVASTLRGGAPSVVDAAERTAGTLESAASYLRTTDGKSLVHDAGEVVKRNPIPAMLGAAALGFLVARGLRR